MQSISMTIDGRRITCPEGTSILNAATKNGIAIPTLCHHPQLKPVGACRICLVEDEKSGRLLASCVTPALPEMAVRTDTDAIKRHRRNIATLMISEHPESCIVCNKGNRCMLRQVAADLGVGKIDLYPIPNPKPLEQANPFIVRDLSKCILCGKCIRADHELVAVGAIDYAFRGIRTHPSTVHNTPLERSNCTFCGTCVTLCPTGALSVKGVWTGTPEREVETVCGYCGVGCRLHLGITGEEVVDVNPTGDVKTVNGATFCVRGHFGHDYLSSPERLRHPMLRGDAGLEPTTWEAALGDISRRLVAIRDEHGPESIGFFGSSKCTSEENFLFQKIARIHFQTNNIDNGGYLYGRQALSLIDRRSDAGGRFHFFAGALGGLEKADVIFVIGADPSHSVPVLSYYIKRGAKKGIPLIVADPRPIDLEFHSAEWLGLAPGSDLDLINGISAIICRREGGDASFLNRFTAGFSDYADRLAALDMDAIIRRTGLSMDRLESASELLLNKKTAFVIGNGFLRQQHSHAAMEALLNLALLTGSIGHGGAGLYVLARENNTVGAWDMGTVPDALPGRRSLDDGPSRVAWERLWHTDLPRHAGLDLAGMLAAAESGELKALYIMGENPLRSLQEPERVRRALENLDYLVVQDILLSETAELANTVLAGAAFSEKNGTFVNLEGRLQRIAAAVPPPGAALPDLEILNRLATALGASETAGTLDGIRAEIGQVLTRYSDDAGAGQSIWLHEGNGDSTPIAFSPVTPGEEPLAQDPAYPVTAIVGSNRYHLGSGTRTSRSRRIAAFNGSGEIEIAAADGRRWGVRAGDGLRLTSPNGSIDGTVRIHPKQPPGIVFVPTGFQGNAAARLLAWTPLMAAASAGWNTCRVNVQKRSQGEAA